MTPKDFAKKYNVTLADVYNVMKVLEKRGLTFTKQGKKYALTPEEAKTLDEELSRRATHYVRNKVTVAFKIEAGVMRKLVEHFNSKELAYDFANFVVEQYLKKIVSGEIKVKELQEYWKKLSTLKGGR